MATSGVTPKTSSGTYEWGNDSNGQESNCPIAAAFFSAQYHPLSDLIAWSLDPWGIFEQPDKNLWAGMIAALIKERRTLSPLGTRAGSRQAR
jgi:hypothetical protein